MKAPDKKVVGLTGSFGSGKSTVANMFRQLGAFVCDADAIAHETLRTGSPVYQKIKKLFPELKAPKDSSLNRKEIAQVVFQDPERRMRLEAVVHPYVFQRLAEEAAAAQEKVVILEVPLLFESGFQKMCDQTIVVKTTGKKITERLKAKGYAAGEILCRQKAQMPLRDKVKNADNVIDNSGNPDKTRRQVSLLWKKINS
ncbi:MAG: dephospho-CoA kinase [Omnitrophica bacterium GWA2_52_8]|nr:MAG: dephospho-CoA kinase [Omnitrophica bacterium GWA2_52_8]